MRTWSSGSSFRGNDWLCCRERELESGNDGCMDVKVKQQQIPARFTNGAGSEQDASPLAADPAV